MFIFRLSNNADTPISVKFWTIIVHFKPLQKCGYHETSFTISEYEPFGWKERNEKKGEKPILSGPPKIGYFWTFPRGSKWINVDLNVGEQCRSTEPTKNSDSDAVYKLLSLQLHHHTLFFPARKCQLNIGNPGEFAFLVESQYTND